MPHRPFRRPLKLACQMWPLGFNTGHWSTYDAVEDHFGRTDLTFDLSQMWPQQVAHRFCSERVGRWRSTTVMAKKAKTAPFDPKVFLATVNGGRSINEPKGLLAGHSCGRGVLYSKWQSQSHRCLRAGQGSRRRGTGAGQILRRGMPDGSTSEIRGQAEVLCPSSRPTMSAISVAIRGKADIRQNLGNVAF